MRVIEIENGISGYKSLVDLVLHHGKKRNPRGIATFDAGPVTVIMRKTNHSLPLHTGRNVNRKIGAAEAVQLIGGFSFPNLLFWASPNFKRFVEPDGRFWGAYGNRINGQLDHIITKLKLDVDTRQAVVTLWDPYRDNQSGKKDYPCTVMLHFAIIDAVLEMTVTMRSQDVWLGTPYDWFQFTQLQHTVARMLHVHPGTYRHITLSTHLYESNLKDMAHFGAAVDPNEWEWQPEGIGRPGDSPSVVRGRARALVDNRITDPTESERWYVDQFAEFFKRPTELG